MWTCVCPGLGEYRLGHRALGAAIIVVFLATCAWLMAGSYVAVQDIAEQVKSADPSLNVPPETMPEVVSTLTRLYSAILAEYHRRAAEVHAKVLLQLWILFGLYCYSVVQSFALGRRKDAQPAAV